MSISHWDLQCGTIVLCIEVKIHIGMYFILVFCVDHRCDYVFAWAVEDFKTPNWAAVILNLLAAERKTCQQNKSEKL